MHAMLTPLQLICGQAVLLEILSLFLYQGIKAAAIAATAVAITWPFMSPSRQNMIE